MDTETFRPAFEAHIRSISPRADFSRAARNGKYFVESTEYRWLGYCAAMESITSDAAVERAGLFAVEHVNRPLMERGEIAEWQEFARTCILAAITPSLAEGA